MELRLVHEERDKLAKELKRTPELIEITLAQLREQCEYPKNSHSDGLKSMWSNVWVYGNFVSECCFQTRAN